MVHVFSDASRRRRHSARHRGRHLDALWLLAVLAVPHPVPPRIHSAAAQVVPLASLGRRVDALFPSALSLPAVLDDKSFNVPLSAGMQR